MIWYMLITLLLCFLMWLLFVPIILYTDTARNRYFLNLPGIFKAVLVPDGGLFFIRIWILFIPLKYNPFETKTKKEKDKPGKKKERHLWRSSNIRTFQEIMHAFRIRKLEADIDTDDFTLNAWLIPVFTKVNRENMHLQVNFEGHQSFVLDLRVTLGALVYNFIRTKYKSFINH